jgi:hypothetical protein
VEAQGHAREKQEALSEEETESRSFGVLEQVVELAYQAKGPDINPQYPKQ